MSYEVLDRVKDMRSKIYILIFLICGFSIVPVKSQKVYTITSGEIVISQNKSSFTREFRNQYPGATINSSNIRFTIFFHAGLYLHYDLYNNIGFYSGVAVRNAGIITDETLPQIVTTSGQTTGYSKYNIVRRQYLLGVPLALKLGSFRDHFYCFAGGEYELAFEYKEKYWSDTFVRSGPKIKSNSWFGNQTPLFMPSVFGGIQFHGGFNLKFTYYLSDFLNKGYSVAKNSQDGSTFNISDLSRYKESRIILFSFCWQFKTASLRYIKQEDIKPDIK
jgi:hypothetical protein